MISMATSGGMSVVGGNNQVFQQFAARSNASINLRTQVISITKQHDPSDTSGAAASQRWLLRSKNLDHGRMSRKTYDAIIFAAPLHQKRPSEVAEVVISGSNISSLVPPLAYVHLYVTLVVTNATNPIPAFFNSKTRVSKTIITTLDPYETGQTATKPKVNSLTYLQSLGKLDNQTGIGHVVKSEPSPLLRLITVSS
jgi:prenylcysteine oxidase/farnesylcysteine lyase